MYVSTIRGLTSRKMLSHTSSHAKNALSSCQVSPKLGLLASLYLSKGLTLWTGYRPISEKKLSNGKKANFLIIVDRASGFIRAYLLKGTKTRHIIEALQDYIDVYVGPPYWLTSDGGPQFAAANAAIKKWAEEAGILHTLSAAYNP